MAAAEAQALVIPFKTDAWLERRLRMIQDAKARLVTFHNKPGEELIRAAVLCTAAVMGGRFRNDWLAAFKDDPEMTALLQMEFSKEDES